MKKPYLHFLFLTLLIYACAPKVKTTSLKKYEPLDYRQEVIIYGLQENKPEISELLGTVKVGDAGMTSKCGYNTVLEEARMAARKMGGNALKITSHKTPDFMSTCHRITAEVLKVGEDEIILSKVNDQQIDSTWDYALLRIYRNGGTGAFVSYNVHLGETPVARVSNKFKQEIKLTKEGLNEIWAKTESKESVQLDVKFGRTYYLRCGIKMGVMVGRPSLELIPGKAGIAEYESLNNKNR